jgi:hypothetical protein
MDTGKHRAVECDRFWTAAGSKAPRRFQDGAGFSKAVSPLALCHRSPSFSPARSGLIVERIERPDANCANFREPRENGPAP